MRNCKLSITIAFGCLLLTNPAKAFWPVCDYCELPAGVVTQVVTAAENLSEMKTQISKMTANLRAIGDVRQTFSNFSKDPYNGGDDSTADTADASATAVNKAYAISTTTQDTIMLVAQNVDETHKMIINNLVAQIEKEIKVANAVTPDYIKMAQNDIAMPVIDEEEEETVDIDKEKENLQEYFAKIKNENSQLNMKMNDLFESSISVMNEGADLNQQAFMTLENALKNSKQDVDSEKRQQLCAKAAELTNKDQENSDSVISLMEDIQSEYNKKYQENIADNINNYQKLVLAYIEGNATADELYKAGEDLKAGVDGIKIFEDKNVFTQYNENSANVKNEMNKLVEDVKDVWADKTDNS